jgi:hypothetical protein
MIERQHRLVIAANSFALAVQQLGIGKNAAIDAVRHALDETKE